MSTVNTRVEEFTSPASVTAKPEDSLDTVMTLMETHGIRHVPIIENENAVGIISEGDLRVALFMDKEKVRTAANIMVKQPYTVSKNDSLADVAFEMSKRKIGSALVEDEDGSLYGIFTSIDGLNALIEIVRADEQN